MDTVASQAPVTESLEELRRLYTIRDAPQVARFLEAHPDLVPLLQEAGPQLLTYFPGARLSLQWITDPEEPIEQLFVGAATGLPIDEAIERLRQFDREWWLPNGLRARGRLCIDLGS